MISFGELDIPVQSQHSQTAHYQATKWHDLSKSWQISMYPEQEDTEMLFTKQSSTLKGDATLGVGHHRINEAH